MSTKADWIMMVNEAARSRGEMSLPGDIILEALDRIVNGIAESEKYPSGLPTLKGVYQVGQELMNGRTNEGAMGSNRQIS